MKASSSPEQDQIRLFIGAKIILTDKTKEIIEQFRKDLKNSSISWVSPEIMHLTIKFIGNKPSFFVNSVNLAILESLKDIRSFNLILRSLGFFGKPLPSVLWIGIGENALLQTIYNRLESNLSEIGIEKESRRFSPHLTLGRVKQMKDLETLKQYVAKYKDLEFQVAKVNKIALFESVLQPRGPIYKPLAEHNLQD
jgi:RNA 2',3'-cyclic 3'-phosphodiesterase